MSNSHLPIPPIPTQAAKAPKTHAEAKAARLQAALRENLRRRKAASAPSDDSNAPDHEKASPNES